MPSTVIRRFAYDPAARELWIEFVTGRRYVYEEVPETVAEALRSAFAKGTYFNSRIRDRFRCRDVTRVDADAPSDNSGQD
jgi:hypothetical protein